MLPMHTNNTRWVGSTAGSACVSAVRRSFSSIVFTRSISSSRLQQGYLRPYHLRAGKHTSGRPTTLTTLAAACSACQSRSRDLRPDGGQIVLGLDMARRLLAGLLDDDPQPQP